MVQQRRLSRSRKRAQSSEVPHWLELTSRGCFPTGSSFSGFSRLSSRHETLQRLSYVLRIRLTTPQPPEKLSTETGPFRQRKLPGCSRRAKPRLAGKHPGIKKEKATECRLNVEGSLGLLALRHDALRHAADAALLAAQRKGRLGAPGRRTCSEVIEEENQGSCGCDSSRNL